MLHEEHFLQLSSILRVTSIVL